MRTRPDRCPGVWRPWPADDGALVRVRIPGGRVSLPALRTLLDVAEEYGDGRLRLTGRANLQLRGLPWADEERLPESVLEALVVSGLVSRSHDLARNILMSPQTGLAGGRADLRPVLAALDEALLADPALGALPGRFQFALDDGRGDLFDRHLDLGLVALDGERAQVRVGRQWGRIVTLREPAGAAAALADLAHRFLGVRGTGPQSAWHVAELAAPLLVATEERAPEPDVLVVQGPLPFGHVPGGHHQPIPPDGAITGDDLTAWSLRLGARATVVLTPFGGVLLPQTHPEETR